MGKMPMLRGTGVSPVLGQTSGLAWSSLQERGPEVWRFAWARCPCYVVRASRPCWAKPPVWPGPRSRSEDLKFGDLHGQDAHATWYGRLARVGPDLRSGLVLAPGART